MMTSLPVFSDDGQVPSEPRLYDVNIRTSGKNKFDAKFREFFYWTESLKFGNFSDSHFSLSTGRNAPQKSHTKIGF